MPRTYFKEFILSQPDGDSPPLPLLPLTHGTKSMLLRDIFDVGDILPHAKPCEVLKERTVFAFYGRPAYKVRPNNEALGRPTAAPAYFILNPAIFDNAWVVHALDTGAFATEHYHANINTASEPRDFEIEKSQISISKFVRLFFGTNSEYFNNVGLDGVSLPAGEEEANAYYSLLMDRGNLLPADERSSTVECAFTEPLEINSDNIMCVVMPSALADEPQYGAAAKALGIDVRVYEFRRGLSSDSHVNSVYDAVLAYYREKGIL